MSTVLVVGSVALDGIETMTEVHDEVVGGSATFCSAAASFFTPVRLVGVVGGDYPEAPLAELSEMGIDLAGLERVEEGKTFRWKGRYVDHFGHRETLETHLNVFEHFQPKIPNTFRDTPYIFLGNIDPVLQLSVLEQENEPTFVACDTMNFWISGKRDELQRVLQRVDLLILNDEEAMELSGEGDLIAAGNKIRSLGPKGVIIKLGPHGAMYLPENGVPFWSPAYLLSDVRDPTGAGDAFAGAFMGCLAKHDKVSNAAIRKSLVMGCAMASFAIEGFGLESFRNIDTSKIKERFLAIGESTSFDQNLTSIL